MSASAKKTKDASTIGMVTRRISWNLSKVQEARISKISTLKTYLDRCLSRWEHKQADCLQSLQDFSKMALAHNGEEDHIEEGVVVQQKQIFLATYLEDKGEWVALAQAWVLAILHMALDNHSIIRQTEVANRDPASRRIVNVSMRVQAKAAEEKAHKS